MLKATHFEPWGRPHLQQMFGSQVDTEVDFHLHDVGVSDDSDRNGNVDDAHDHKENGAQ